MPDDTEPTVRWGWRVWTAIGVVVLLIGLFLFGSQVSLLLTPFVLALFPAALLDPIASRMRASRIPNALGSLILLLLLLGAFGAVFWFVTVAVIDQVPQIAASVMAGLQQLDQNVDWSQLPGDIESLSDLASQAVSAIAGSGVLTQGLSAVGAVTSFFAAALLIVVVLFFFFKDGRRMWDAFLDFVPRRHQRRVDLVAQQSFWTIGAYLRGQLLIAFVDAVFIGLGLWVLGVPLVLPLAVLVFIGGLFPIVGAVATGAVAVLVALADQGLVTALLVLGVVLLVQQLEGNLLEPIVMSRTLAIHPLLIIFAVTGGGVLMGVLGAFLGVPVAAVIARIVDNLSGRTPPEGPASTKDYLGRDLDPGSQPDDEPQEVTASDTRQEDGPEPAGGATALP